MGWKISLSAGSAALPPPSAAEPQCHRGPRRGRCRRRSPDVAALAFACAPSADSHRPPRRGPVSPAARSPRAAAGTDPGTPGQPGSAAPRRPLPRGQRLRPGSACARDARGRQGPGAAAARRGGSPSCCPCYGTGQVGRDLSGSSGPPCPDRVILEHMHKIASRRVWNISRERDSTTALDSLFQCVVTCTVKKFFLVFRTRSRSDLSSTEEPRTGHSIPGAALARAELKGVIISLSLLAVLFLMHAGIPLVSLAARARCCLRDSSLSTRTFLVLPSHRPRAAASWGRACHGLVRRLPAPFSAGKVCSSHGYLHACVCPQLGSLHRAGLSTHQPGLKLEGVV
ncbi:uncharacterized protein LOC141725204 [Zonotrichia albicollis]|uniref:uncharacterized protein LOC141725204 n=1 Tax=Zonotrichia albicollis TaxID=44394 RepID=UPI003D80D230